MLAAARSVLDWLENPAEDNGIRFSGPDGTWDFWSYSRLAALTRQFAAGLTQRGIGNGQRVTLIQSSGPHFVASFFGAMLAGAVPSPAAPPLVFGDIAAYADHVNGLVHTARSALVVADAQLVDTIREILADAATAPPVADFGDVPATEPADRTGRTSARDLALLQFTSGSTGRSRGVEVSHGALASNVAAIHRWLRWTPADATASWLPVHHDMGLIGCLVAPVVMGGDLWLLAPGDFLREPARYLRCFGEFGARLTAMPNFGLEYVTRRVSPDALTDCDFTAWRAVIIGAEHIDPDSLRRFHAALAPFGLSRQALLPAYGLAESTLAVTGVPLDEEWSCATVDPDALAVGSPLRQVPDGQPIVGCGRPLAGLTVTIVDSDRAELSNGPAESPEGTVGEIVVRGSSVADGYADSRDTRTTTLSAGELRSGDAGFVLDGQLFVLGRLGDSIKIRGTTVFAEDLEAAMAGLGLRAHRCAVLLGMHRQQPTVVAMLEQELSESAIDALVALLRRRTETARIVLVTAARGAIARTSSGKVRRRQLWNAFVTGQLPGTVLYDTQEPKLATGGRRS